MSENDLYQRIYQVVSKIPKGRVATYGQIAALAGVPRAARMVGWALQSLPLETKAPWHRVVNREGRITIEHPVISKAMQADILKKEGVEVNFENSNFFVNIKEHLWQDSL
jgi:methylated-DNA-protein-cysteine methyltransferase-like protein